MVVKVVGKVKDGDGGGCSKEQSLTRWHRSSVMVNSERWSRYYRFHFVGGGTGVVSLVEGAKAVKEVEVRKVVDVTKMAK